MPLNGQLVLTPLTEMGIEHFNVALEGKDELLNEYRQFD
jgi:hypothetical protein